MSDKKVNRAYLFSIVLVAVLGGLLFGYDTAVISGAEKGLQAFFMGASDFQYTDFMHGITSSAALLGCIIGSALSGLLASGLGRKKTLFVAGILFFLSALGSYLPEFLFFEKGVPTFGLLIAFNLYRVLGGLGVGIASALCPMYIAEISPARMRGTLVSWNQFAIIFGQLVVYFVNLVILGKHIAPVIESVASGINQITNGALLAADANWSITTGWRLMFVSECVPAGLFTLLVLLILVSAGLITACVYIILYTLDFIPSAVGVKVVIIGILLSVFQQAIGINAVLYYAPRIFESLGMGNPMLQTVLMGIVNITFTLVAVFTVEKLGRKPLLIVGSIGMAVGALGVAVTSVSETLPPVIAAVSIMVYSACFMFSWGPICWVLISEIFPNTIRSQATAIAVAFQWIFNFIVSSTFVPMYNMSHAFTYGLYCAMCVIAALFVWKFVPETKGKTLEEMNALWKRK